MYKLSHFSASTGKTETLLLGSEKSVKNELDALTANSSYGIKSVSSSYVKFRNGDVLKVAAVSPLSAIMLTKEERGYEDDGFDSDTIFT